LTEVLIGVGIGECSSDEEKYKWRKPVCDEEFNETPEDRKRIAWKKYQNNTYQQKQVRTNPADVANTILKMAKKRAQIDMTLTATAASDVFDQDLEDLPEGVAEGVADNKKPPLKEPQKKESGGTTIKDPNAAASEPQIKAIHAILGKLGITDDLAKHEKVSNILVKDETLTSFTVLTKGEASTVINALSAEAEGK
jgi:hypothetical protein